LENDSVSEAFAHFPFHQITERSQVLGTDNEGLEVWLLSMLMYIAARSDHVFIVTSWNGNLIAPTAASISGCPGTNRYETSGYSSRKWNSLGDFQISKASSRSINSMILCLVLTLSRLNVNVDRDAMRRQELLFSASYASCPVALMKGTKQETAKTLPGAQD